MRLEGIGRKEFTIRPFIKDVIKTEKPKTTSAPDKPVQRDDIAVKVSISKKLLEFKSFEERIKENDPNDPLVSGLDQEARMMLLEQMEGKEVMKGHFRLLSIGGGSGRAVMNHMVEAYAKRYDKLVQGHKDGIRSVFITDSKTGEFRTLTLEEELQELDQCLKDSIDCFNRLVERIPKLADFLEEYAEQSEESVKKYGGTAAIDMAKKARDHAKGLRRDLKSIPETAREREQMIYSAIHTFLAQYRRSTPC